MNSRLQFSNRQILVRLVRVVSITASLLALGQQITAQESTPTEHSSLSPDKKWEYSDGDESKLVKASTNEVALEFSEGCDLGALDEHSEILWAPDSTMPATGRSSKRIRCR
jgi:hypothetical protein